MAPSKGDEDKEVPLGEVEFSNTWVTPKSPKIPIQKSDSNFNNTTDRRDRIESFQSEEGRHLEISSSNKLLTNTRKPSESMLLNKGLLNDGVSSVTANQSSDMITAHFHSNYHKSMTSNDSPNPDKDMEHLRETHDDPINFLNRFNLLWKE